MITTTVGWPRVVKDSAQTSFPIFQETLSNFFNSNADGLWSALNLDNALGRLRQHLFRGNHARTGNILDSLYLESISTDNGAHEVV